MKTKNVIRQGDVLLLPLPSKEKRNLGQKLSHLTIAEGEVTGHSHRISNGEAELYEREGVLYMRVLSHKATLAHEEHNHLTIPHGDWMIRIQREYYPVKNNIKKFSPLKIKNPIQPQPKIQPQLKIDKSTVIQSKKTQINKINEVNEVNDIQNKSSYHPKKEAEDSLSQEILDLANKIDANYWNRFVSDAEKRKQYQDKIILNSKLLKQDSDSENNEEEKTPRKKIKYVDNLPKEIIPAHLLKKRSNGFSLKNVNLRIPDINFSDLISIKNDEEIQKNSSPSPIMKRVKNSQRKVSITPEEFVNWRSVVD